MPATATAAATVQETKLSADQEEYSLFPLKGRINETEFVKVARAYGMRVSFTKFLSILILKILVSVKLSDAVGDLQCAFGSYIWLFDQFKPGDDFTLPGRDHQYRWWQRRWRRRWPRRRDEHDAQSIYSLRNR
jgi:hypothetical protein